MNWTTVQHISRHAADVILTITHLRDDRLLFTAPVSPVISCTSRAPGRGSPTIERAVPLFTYQPVTTPRALRPSTRLEDAAPARNDARMSTTAARTTTVDAATSTQKTHAPHEQTNHARRRTRDRPQHADGLLMRCAAGGAAGRCAITPTANLLVSRPAMTHW